MGQPQQPHLPLCPPPEHRHRRWRRRRRRKCAPRSSASARPTHRRSDSATPPAAAPPALPDFKVHAIFLARSGVQPAGAAAAVPLGCRIERVVQARQQLRQPAVMLGAAWRARWLHTPHHRAARQRHQQLRRQRVHLHRPGAPLPAAAAAAAASAAAAAAEVDLLPGGQHHQVGGHAGVARRGGQPQRLCALRHERHPRLPRLMTNCLKAPACSEQRCRVGRRRAGLAQRR
eukprot:365921-Chlamydomonas_euryale.AAC.1